MSAANNDFLGNGWAFHTSSDPTKAGVGLDTRNNVAESSGNEKIRESLWLILSTAPGERIGRPDFGCGIHDLVFRTRTAGTMGNVMRAVTEAIETWEPRVDLVSVEARPHPQDPQGILVDIQVEVRSTNSRMNLVFPYYLST